MAEDKNSFIAYCEWGEIFEALSDEEAGKLVKHLFQYVNDKNPKAKDKTTELLFISIKQALKRDLIKYTKYIDKQRINGKKGGRPKTQKTQPFFEKPKKADNVNVNDNVNDNFNYIYFLKENFPSKFESMKIKLKGINEEEFFKFLNSKCIIEEIPFNFNKINARFNIMLSNWKKSNEGKKETKSKKIFGDNYEEILNSINSVKDENKRIE